MQFSISGPSGEQRIPELRLCPDPSLRRGLSKEENDMSQETDPTLQARLVQIQRKVRLTQTLALVCLCGLIFEGWALTRPAASLAQRMR